MKKQQELKSLSQLSRKRGKKTDEILSLVETKLKFNQFLISNVLINSYISQEEFVSVNNVLRGYNEMKSKIL